MKNLKKIFLVFALALIFIPNVKAEEMLSNSSLPENKSAVNYRTDNAQADDDLTVTGNYDSSTFFAGNNVYDNTNVNGISFVAGNSVNLSGNYNYGFVAGNIIDIKGSYQNDLFVAGNFVSTDYFRVTKDAYMIGSTISLRGLIERNAYLTADTITLENVKINGNLEVFASTLELGDNVVINGTLKYNDDCKVGDLNKASITSVMTYKSEESFNEKDNTLVMFQDFLLSLVGLILIGYILYALCPSVYEKLKGKTKEYNFTEGLKDTAFGLLTLIGYPIIMLILLFTLICIPVSVIGLILYGIAIYLTTLVIGYLLGNLLLEKALGKTVNGYISILVGVLIIKVLKLVPFVGGLVSFIVLCLGLGLIIKLLFSKTEKPKEDVVEATYVEKVKPTKRTKKEEK